MPLDPFSAAIGKTAVTSTVKPTLSALRSQIARRGSEFTDVRRVIGTEPELDEAIAVLSGQTDSLPQWALAKLKGALSGRPSTFGDADARHFIADDRAIALVKSGVRRTFADEDIGTERTEARAIHAELFGEEGIFGETLIEDATNFAVMTLLARLAPSDRILGEMLRNSRADILEAVQQASGDVKQHVSEELRDIKNLVSGQKPPEVEAPILDAAIEAEVRRLTRQRFVHGNNLIARAEALGARLDGGLQLASPSARALAAREIAVILARAERADEAEPWIERAVGLGANDVATERARIHLARQQVDEAMRLLRDRDDRVGRSLLIDAIQRRDGETAALAYFEAHLSGAVLTGHALQAMGARLVNAERLDEAIALLDAANTDQIDENPVMLFVRGRMKLVRAMPSDVAKRFWENEGMIPRPADVRDDAAGAVLLEGALADFRQLQAALPDLDSPDFAVLADMNILALSLMTGSAAERAAAHKALLERLKDPNQAAQLVPLASIYNIAVDWSGLSTQLDQAEGLGGWDDTQLRAAFALVMKADVPADIATFTRKYRDRLQLYMADGSVVAIEIEALARSGDIAGAKALLAERRDALGKKHASFLEATLSEIEGGDAVAVRIAQYEQTSSTHDLEILVGTLASKRDDRTGDYLILLWEARHHIDDAVRACDALATAGKEERLEAFLEELGEQARQHPHLRTHLAWARQRQGRLKEAESELRALKAEGVDNSNVRQLTIILAVETGRWSELEPFVQDELAHADTRAAGELMAAAGIAQAIDSSTAMDLSRAAIARAPDDPQINIGGYQVAIGLGVERTVEVNQWLARAIATSSEDGPIFSRDYEDVVTMVKESREHSDRINDMVLSAQVPLFIAMKPLGGTQSELILSRMYDNADLIDARQRVVLPLFAGNRQPAIHLNLRSVAFDPLSILVLDYLGLLERTLAAFDDVMLPAGTLHSFFEDKTKAKPSQPSRIEQAREIKDRVADGTLTIEALPTAGAEEAALVGTEFAQLYAAAVTRDGFVVDTQPLHKPGQLREIIDSAPYADRLLSPAGLVTALKDAGILSSARSSAAEAVVAGGGSRWEVEPEPIAGKTMFLSMLAVQYLNDARLLPTLKAHAGTLVILPEVVQFADQEIAAGAFGTRVRGGIERIREVLARAIATDRVRIGPTRVRRDEKEDKTDHTGRDMNPIMSAMRDTGGIEALVCDDRGMNKYLEFTDRNERSVLLLTTPDILTILNARNVLSDEELMSAKEKLRSGGAGLMPLDAQEVLQAAVRSNWAVGPNAELRAIRDSIHLPLARKVVQLPNERPWFRAVAMAIAFAIRRVWQEIEDPILAERAASYLLDMIPDAVIWSAADESPDRDLWVQDTSRQVVWAIASLFDLPPSRIDAFRHWFDNLVGPRAKRRDPGVLEAIARMLFSFLSRPTDEESELDEHELPKLAPEEELRVALFAIVPKLPETISRIMLADESVIAGLGFPVGDFVELLDARFNRADLFVALRAIANEQTTSLASADGKVVIEEIKLDEDGAALLSSGSRGGRFPNVALLADSFSQRDAALNRIVAKGEMSAEREGQWRAAITIGPLDDTLFTALEAELTTSPEANLSAIEAEIGGGEAQFNDLVPLELNHYMGLLGIWPLPTTLSDYKKAWLAKTKTLDPGRLLRLLRVSAPLSCMTGGLIAEASDALDPADRLELVAFLQRAPDPFSVAAAFEVACRCCADGEMAAHAGALIPRLFNRTDPLIEQGGMAFATAMMITTATTARHRTLETLPLYARRLARLMHASHLLRVFRNARVDPSLFRDDIASSYLPQARLADLLDARMAPVAQMQHVGPALIHSLIIRRVSEAISALDEADRPVAWIEHGAAAMQDDVQNHWGIFFFAPAPMDEFEAGWEGLSFRAKENFQAMLNALTVRENREQVVSDLFKLSISLDLEGDQRGAYAEALPSFLTSLEGHEFSDYTEIALQLAARWRDTNLSDRLVELVVDRARAGTLNDGGAIPRYILLGANSVEVREAWLDRAADLARRFAFSHKTGIGPGNLVRAFELLRDYDSELASQLATARSFALMGFQRLPKIEELLRSPGEEPQNAEA